MGYVVAKKYYSLVGLRSGDGEGKISAGPSAKGKKPLPKVMPNLKNNDFLVEFVVKLVIFKKFRGSTFESSLPH